MSVAPDIENKCMDTERGKEVGIDTYILSHVWLFVTPWTEACQAPWSMGILQVQKLESVAISFSNIYTTMYKTDN